MKEKNRPTTRLLYSRTPQYHIEAILIVRNIEAS